MIKILKSQFIFGSLVTLCMGVAFGADLVPGSGFVGSTPEPARQGSPSQAGYDAQSIARWDVVPRQIINGNLDVGVVAFHMNGIEKVAMSLENGPWVDVTAASLNVTTGVKEYTARLKATDFSSDRMVELRAIAYPVVGRPRVLDPLVLFVNAHGTYQPAANTFYVKPSLGSDTNPGTAVAPFQTIAKALNTVDRSSGGVVVLLEEGDYIYGDPTHIPVTSTQPWTTVRSAEGLNPDNVMIHQGVRTTHINPRLFSAHFKNVTFNFAKFFRFYNVSNDMLMWFDHSKWINTDPGAAQNDSATYGEIWGPTYGHYYATDSRAENLLYGFTSCSLMRNCTLNMIMGDALQMSRMVLNVSVDTMQNPWSGHHKDLYQMWDDMDNTIVYGVRAVNIEGTQGILLQPRFADVAQAASVRNTAFVDVRMQNSDPTGKGDPPWSQMQHTFDHIIMDNVRLPNQRIVFRTDLITPAYRTWNAKNVYLRHFELYPLDYTAYVTDSEGRPVSPAAWPSGVTFESCYRGGDLPFDVTHAESLILTPGLTQGPVPLTIPFDGSSSASPDPSTITSWNWDFGDGFTGTGPKVDHTYVSIGTFTVSLTVTSSAGQVDVSTKTVIATKAAGGGLVFGLTFDNHVVDSSPHKIPAGPPEGAPTYVAGRVGQAMHFTNTPKTILWVYKDPHLFGMSELTLALWAKKDAADVGGYVVHNYQRYQMRIDQQSVYLVLYKTDGSEAVKKTFTVPAINNTDWHHYAAVYDGSLLRLYVDGVDVGQQSGSGSVGELSYWNLAIGADPWGTSFAGSIDELQIYARALSPDKVGLLAAGAALVDTPPQVTLVSLVDEAVITTAGSAALKAIATDDGIIQRVELYRGVDLVQTVTKPPYEIYYRPTSRDNGTHTWTARATDDGGKSAVSAPLTVTMDIPPIEAGSKPRAWPVPWDPSQTPEGISFSGYVENTGIQILSLNGQSVKKLMSNDQGTFTWDGRDDSGKDAPSGVYWVLPNQGPKKNLLKITIKR